MRAIIALAVLVGCAETETTEAEAETTETETTETTEQTAAEAFEDAAERVEENFGDENTIETPAKTTTPSGESAVSSD
jgi:shikimate kinase